MSVPSMRRIAVASTGVFIVCTTISPPLAHAESTADLGCDKSIVYIGGRRAASPNLCDTSYLIRQDEVNNEYDSRPPTPSSEMSGNQDMVTVAIALGDNTGNLTAMNGGYDFADETASIVYSEAIGDYAAAVIVARDQLGLTPLLDTPVEMEHQVSELADYYLLNGVASLVPRVWSPVADDALVQAEAYLRLVQQPHLEGTRSSHGAAAGMNSKEKKVCAREPHDCYRARNTPTLAYASAEEWYPTFRGHNDVRDAFRHCIWNAFMVKRANRDFAKRFATAHEEGDSKQPGSEFEMDMYNNWWGREAGDIWDDNADQRHEEQCVYYALAPRDLYWFVGTSRDGNRYKGRT